MPLLYYFILTRNYCYYHSADLRYIMTCPRAYNPSEALLGLKPCSPGSGDSEGKESACSAGSLGLIPGSGRTPGEGHGNPLQYSCLENPMDRGAERATVQRVAKSPTRLSDLIFTLGPKSRWGQTILPQRLQGRFFSHFFLQVYFLWLVAARLQSLPCGYLLFICLWSPFACLLQGHLCFHLETTI